MATNTLCQVSAEYEAYALQTSLMKGELDWRSGIADAEKKGRNEASLDIARNLKGMGLSISQIAEGTGLSPETIAEINV
jgi:predicted transposase YdaD